MSFASGEGGRGEVDPNAKENIKKIEQVEAKEREKEFHALDRF